MFNYCRRRIMELEFVSSVFFYSIHIVANNNKSCAPFKWPVPSSLLMVARPPSIGTDINVRVGGMRRCDYLNDIMSFYAVVQLSTIAYTRSDSSVFLLLSFFGWLWKIIRIVDYLVGTSCGRCTTEVPAAIHLLIVVVFLRRKTSRRKKESNTKIRHDNNK